MDARHTQWGALKDVGQFCSNPTQPKLRVYAEREIENCGAFGVFWYRHPSGHTKTGARHRGETEWVTKWALVQRAGDGSWQVGAALPGFKTREEALSRIPRPSEEGR